MYAPAMTLHDADAQTTSLESRAEGFGGVLARIRARASSLPDSERIVADFIAAHPGDVVQLPITDLAVALGVSTATIIRCTRSLGFTGLRDLKYSLAVDAAAATPAQKTDVTGTDRAIDIARAVLNSDVQAISDTIATLDNATLERSVAALLAAKRIVLFGTGASGIIASDGYFRFLRRGMPVSIDTDPYTQGMTAQHLGPQDVAFAISRTGRTMSVMNALAIAKEHGATTLLLTSFPRSPMTAVADIAIVTASHEESQISAAMNSRITHLSILDALFLACTLRRNPGDLAVDTSLLKGQPASLTDDDPLDAGR